MSNGIRKLIEAVERHDWFEASRARKDAEAELKELEHKANAASALQLEKDIAQESLAERDRDWEGMCTEASRLAEQILARDQADAELLEAWKAHVRTPPAFRDLGLLHNVLVRWAAAKGQKSGPDEMWCSTCFEGWADGETPTCTCAKGGGK